MSGRVLGGASSVGLLPVLLVACLFLAPAAIAGGPSEPLTVEALTLPAEAGDAGLPAEEGLESFLAWTADVPLEELEQALRVWADAEGGATRVLPTALPEYDWFDEDEKRVLWRAWALAVAKDRIGLPQVDSLFQQSAANDDHGADAGPDGELAIPRGLRGLWSLEAHGRPREVVPLGDGAYLLVTSRGVLRFNDAGPTPDWMIKTGSTSRFEVADLNGDEVPDLIIGLYTSFSETDQANVVVVDGASGEILHEAFRGEDRLIAWSLADASGDGSKGLIGITLGYDLVRAGFDGTITWRVPLEESSSIGQSALVAYVYLAYQPLEGVAFADVDGDGVKDLVIQEKESTWLYVLLVASFDEETQKAVAYSGADGSELWTAELPGAGYWNIIWGEDTGDIDGDGREDILYWQYVYRFNRFGTVSLFGYSEGYFVISGEQGELMIDDREDLMYVQGVQSPTSKPGVSYLDVVGVADMDGDGMEELVSVEAEFTDGLSAMSIVGRATPEERPGTSVEVWRQELPIGGTHEEWGIRPLFRTLDGEADPKLMLLFISLTTDEGGNMTSADGKVFLVDPGSVQVMSTGGVVSAYDIDTATGQAYAWTMDDRWVPMDAEGNRIGKGMRIQVNVYPLLERDRTGDQIPDLLLTKTSGYVWIDGKDGKAIEDIERPLNRDRRAVAVEAGRVRIVEYDWDNRIYWLTDLASAHDVWRFRVADHEPDRGSMWVNGFVDVTGDGLLDVIYGGYIYGDDFWENYQTVYDPATSEEVWRSSRSGSTYFVDALPDRPGHEILRREYHEDPSGYQISMHVPEADEPLWTDPLGQGSFVAAGSGYVYVRGYGEGLVLTVLDAYSGEVRHDYAFEADSSLANIRLGNVVGTVHDEAVVSYDVGDWRDAESRVAVFDPSVGEVLARFNVTSAEYREIVYSDYSYWYRTSSTYVDSLVGDWDGDGWNDIALWETQRPVVRSGESGAVLAVASSKGGVAFAEDLDGNGRKEIGIVTENGRLRLVTHDAKQVDEAPEERVVRVDKPDQVVTEDDTFFEEDSGLIPAPGAWFLVVLGLLAWSRRRRGC